MELVELIVDNNGMVITKPADKRDIGIINYIKKRRQETAYVEYDCKFTRKSQFNTDLQVYSINKKRKKLYDFWENIYYNYITNNYNILENVVELKKKQNEISINLLMYMGFIHMFSKNNSKKETEESFVNYLMELAPTKLSINEAKLISYTPINDIDYIEYGTYQYKNLETNEINTFQIYIVPSGYITFTGKIHRNHYSIDIFPNKLNLTENDFIIYKLMFMEIDSNEIQEEDTTSMKTNQNKKNKKTKTQMKKDKKNKKKKQETEPTQQPIQEPIEYNSIEDNSIDDNSTEDNSTEDNSTDNNSIEDNSTDNNSTDDNYSNYDNKPYHYQVSFKSYIMEQEFIIDMINRAYDNKPKFREFLYRADMIWITKGIHNNIKSVLEKHEHFNIILHFGTFTSKKYHLYIEDNEIIYYTEVIKGMF